MKRIITLTLAMMSSACFAASADLGSQVAAGKQLFETTCAASTCHGSGGVGATAPKLVDRNFSLDLVRATLLNGRPGTAMPAFKDLFDADMMASVTAYVLSISTGGRWATAVPVEQEIKTAKAFPARIAIGKESGNPTAGYAFFYDATQMTACRTCHRHRDNGGPVGRDLAEMKASAAEIYARMSKPMTTESVTLTTDTGDVRGLKKSETAEVIKIVDLSSLPPVVRSFQTARVKAVKPSDAPFDHAALGYAPQALRDAAAFLSVK